MLPPSRLQSLTQVISSTLARMFGVPPKTPPNVVPWELIRDWSAEQDRRAVQHWATDGFAIEAELLPVREASLIIQQLCQLRGGAQFYAWAEDGGFYLYRYADEKPFARVSGIELTRSDLLWERGGVWI